MKPHNHKDLVLASILLLVVLLSGCGLPWPFPQPTPASKLPDAQQVFRPLDSGPNAGDLDTIDPALIQFHSDADKAQLIFPQLVTLDDKQQPMDWAAESHEISADGLTYTFHLHHGMVWSDGTPVDATTFAYSMNRSLDPCLASGTAYFLFDLAGAVAFNSSKCPPGAIKSTATLIGTTIQTPDPLTLRLTLAHPAGYFLAALSWPTSWAVPQPLVERYGARWTEHLTDNSPFGGNLYLLTKWQHTATAPLGSLIFERNERFWGKKPLLRRIEYTLYPHAGDAWNDFKQAGKGDIGTPAASNTPFVSAGSLADEIAVARALKGVTVQQTPQLSVSFMAVHWGRAPFDDVRMRQAFSLALDRQAIARDVYQDRQLATIHFVPEGMPGYNADLADAAGRTGKDALTPDLNVARRLANAYAAEKCGGALAGCPAVIILRISASASEMKLTDLMKQQWEAAFPGLAITFQGPDRSGFPYYYHLASDGWGADYPDPQDFTSVVWNSTSQYNRTAVSIPQVDALRDQADRMTDLTERIPLYQQAEQLLVTQGAAIPYGQPLLTSAVRSHVVGWRIASTRQTLLAVWQTVYLRG